VAVEMIGGPRLCEPQCLGADWQTFRSCELLGDLITGRRFRLTVGASALDVENSEYTTRYKAASSASRR